MLFDIIILILFVIVLFFMINKKEYLTNTPQFQQMIQSKQEIDYNLDIDRDRSQDNIETEKNLLITTENYDIA